ncbi:MAG TPA: DUF6377 domain-containing protein [Puia sp.]|jgi:hypothetical protein
MMKFLLPILGLMLLSCPAKSEDPTDSLLTVLRAEILKKSGYDTRKEAGIRRLKLELAATAKNDYAGRYAILNTLYDEYKGYIFDSSYTIVLQLLALSKSMHDPSLEAIDQLKMGYVELESGRIKESFDRLALVNVQHVSREAQLRYYELKTRAYSDLDTYNTHQFYSDSNRRECMKALDTALLLSESGSFEREKHVAEVYNLAGERDKAAAVYTQLLANDQISDWQRARAAYDLSELTDSIHGTRLLISSAICDIRVSQNRTMAAFKLGQILFRQGDLANAKLVLQLAMDQAAVYGPGLRVIEIEAHLNRVGAQMLIDSENNKNRVLIGLLFLLAIAIAATALIAINVYKRLKSVRQREQIVEQQNRHLDRINKKLLEDAGIKEEYIGYFFNIISTYIARLELIKRNIEHDFKIKNYDDVLKLAREIDLKHERHELFYTFDKIFLKLFPNFIIRFNSLLRPEDQIWPKQNEALNTSLRIFALMRLGIQDNRIIASILESSVSTIYTYKARIRSKALFQGEEFDNKIMEIQFAEFGPLSEPVFEKNKA